MDEQEQAPTEQEQEQEQEHNSQILLPIIIISEKATTEASQRAETEAISREIEDLIAQQGMNNATQEINDATQKINNATQEMNDATQRLADYAFWSTILVAVGTVFLLRTLVLTRQANDAAQESIKITREIGESQTRAYVHISEFKPFFWRSGNNISCHIQIKLTNSGMSPAYFNGYKTETKTTNPDNATSNKTLAKREIGPNGSFTITLPYDLNINNVNDPTSVETIIRFNYTDIFDATHSKDVKYVSNFNLNDLPPQQPEFIAANSHDSFCHGFVDSTVDWNAPLQTIP